MIGPEKSRSKGTPQRDIEIRLKYFIAPLLIFGAYFIFIGCGLDNIGGRIQCLTESDCGIEEQCMDSGECGDSCESDENCASAQSCIPKLLVDGSIGDVCIAVDPVEEFCSNDVECSQKLGISNAKCSIDKICYVPQTLFSILIRDTSPAGPTGMDGLDGSDIGAVFLTSNDIIVANGITLVAENAAGDALSSPIDGSRVRLNEDMTCIDGDFGTDTVHLGPQGFLLVRFLDTDFGDYLEGPSNWNVNVVEWGKNCAVADDGDTYEVLLCTSSSYENIDFDRECVPIGNGEGFSKFTTDPQ